MPPRHREARLDADDVVALDERAAVVVRDWFRARARRLVRHVANGAEGFEFAVLARAALRARAGAERGEPEYLAMILTRRFHGARAGGLRLVWWQGSIDDSLASLGT